MATQARYRFGSVPSLRTRMGEIWGGFGAGGTGTVGVVELGSLGMGTPQITSGLSQYPQLDSPACVTDQSTA